MKWRNKEMSKTRKRIMLVVVFLFIINSLVIVSFAEDFTTNESFTESTTLNQEKMDDEIIESTTEVYDFNESNNDEYIEISS